MDHLQKSPKNQGLDIQPKSWKLDSLNGYSLLLITVSSLNDAGTRRFIVAVTDEKADKILNESRLTVHDYERDDIMRAFKENQKILKQDIESAKKYFRSHFITEMKMKFDF